MTISKHSCRWGLIGLVALLANSARADEPAWPSLETRFRELPNDARRQTGPLFWLHGDESPARLRETLAKVAEGGNGMFTAESRPHNDWLGPGWFRDLAVCLDAAKALDLKMWIFDEEWWPSGEVGGRVPLEFSAKRLGIRGFIKTAGNEPLDVALDIPAEKLIAVLAGRETGSDRIDADSIVDLTANVKDGRLTWTPAPGNWRVMPIAWDYSPPRQGRRLIDGASQKAVDWYIKTVYQSHHDHFGADFGKTIQGYFYDEPETLGDWGTEVIPELTRRGVDWKKAIVAYALGLSDAADDAAYKFQYRHALAEAWGRTLYGGITAWCRAHNVRSMGHMMEHNHEYLSTTLCAGDMMQLQKYSDMGGIDAVFKQFVPGRKDNSTYQTPKLGSSITHAYGMADDLTMVEIYGARGQDLSYPEMKWWCDLMQVAGVNVHIPHSFNPRAPYDVDCPPYFYNGGYEPRFPLYRVYANYTSRLSLLLSGGRHVAPVALLYLGQSFHVGKSITPENLTTALQDSLYDCDWIPYDVLRDGMSVEDGKLTLRDERYRALVVPPVEVIPHEALEKAKAFYDAGGVVIGYGFTPSKSATPGHSPEAIRALCEAIWGASPRPSSGIVNRNDRGGLALFLAEQPTAADVARALGEAGVEPTLQVVEGDTGGWLHALHRVKNGRDVFLIVNQNLDGGARRFQLRLKAPGSPECWDAMRNEITAVPFKREGDYVSLGLTLEPQESVALVFAPEARPLPPRLQAGAAPIGDPIAVERDPNAAAPTPSEPERPVSPWTEWLRSRKWVWAPARQGEAAPAPGARFFRKVATLPALPADAQATFWIAADNQFALHVNGRAASVSGGGAGDWRRPADVNVTKWLAPGDNVFAITATNGGNAPNPAGLIGVLVITRPNAETITIPIDSSWTVAPGDVQGDAWTRPDYDAAGWAPAREIASFGDAPWDAIASPIFTSSPVKADPFAGHATLPATTIDPKTTRVCLELDGVEPEAAARVWINDHDAGGFIGRPFRLDVSAWIQPGRNTVRVEPFAPKAARIVLYPR